ncbi:c myc promoter binding protein [Echinococcus multilocularis]|uniref:C myc promoter binding protein n=1 Tax=Echinococcus multilocularis TaxID=6211 RepID=A0A068XVF0_ECHMU|nr:c myc promoter binding protein [Echinococcus multilocularis]
MNDVHSNGGGSKHIAEYFAVCGLSEKPSPFNVSEILLNSEEIVLSESKCLDFSRYTTPIIDIQLVNMSQKEHPPDGYQLIDKSIGGSTGCFLQSRSGDDLCICYRRGYDIPPIGDIGLVDIDQRLKPNSSNITHTIDHRPAVIMKKRFLPTSNMYLSYSRLHKNYGVDELALTDICVVLKKKGERCPLGYKELPQKLIHSLMADDMHICYKKSFVKRYIATYQPEVLMWYHVPSAPSSPSMATDEMANQPIFNTVDIATLSNFCLPWGAAIESWSVDQNPPGSVFFTFVVTNAAYKKFHGSALTFYEPYDVSQLDRDRCYRLNVDPELVRMEDAEEKAEGGGRQQAAMVVREAEAELFTQEELLSIEQRQGVFASSRIGDRVLGVTKTLCLVSRFNFGNGLKPFLDFLHFRCFSSKDQSIPLERYLAFILCEIPFPDRRSPNITVDLDDYHMQLQIPYGNHLSSSGEPFAHLLHRLGSELTLQLMVQLLTEQKLLFVSVMPDLLVDTIQQLITLIHPLRWVLVYIPLIHMRCIHVIQSPSPYLIGVDSRFFEFFQLPSAEADISVVDLDTRQFRPATTTVAGVRIVLPRGPQRRLRTALIRNEERLAELDLRMHQDAKMGVRVQEKYKSHLSLLGANVRRACYTFMTELLQDYRKFLLPVIFKDRELLFDSEGFVKHTADRASNAFYATLVGTQLWADFVRDLNCISERTAELEAFDNAIAHLSLTRYQSKTKGCSSRGIGGSGDIGGGGGGETCSQVSSGSGGDAGSAASAPLNGFSASPRDSLSGTDGSSLSGRPLPPSECPRIIGSPSGLLELDPLCSDLPLNGFTWTRRDHFPETVNTSLLDELCTRLRHNGATAAATSPSRTMVTKVETGEEELIFRLVDDTAMMLGDGEDFCPSLYHTPPPLPFVHGNGVPKALGVAQLNSLLKRTLQETTDCLIAATKRRNAGGVAWAGQLLSEVYSLWFLLLPAFIASLQQHRGRGNNGDGICLEARHFLFHVVDVFLRLWDSPLQPVDQVYVRVLIALLYEYGTSDQGVVSFWSSRPLNAPSYAMANQLQRDLGHKLTSSESAEDGAESGIGISTTLSREVADPLCLVPQALSTPIQNCDASSPRHPCESQPSFSIGGDEEDGGDNGDGESPSKSSSNFNLANSQLVGSMDRISISDGNRKTSGLLEPVEQAHFSKKGWKSFAQASMRKLASFRVEYVNPDVITLDQSPSTSPSPQPSQHLRSRSVSTTANKSIGYFSLFGHPGAGTRLPRNMRPWAVAPISASVSSITTAACGTVSAPVNSSVSADEALRQGADATQMSLQSSTSSSLWFQLLQRHLSVSAMSPTPSRRPETSDTPRGSITSNEEGVVNTTVAASPLVFSFDSQLAVLSYQPTSWYTIAGPLAVGSVGDRVCLANPLVMKLSPSSLQSSVTAPAYAAMRQHRSRSSSLVRARRDVGPKHSPSASFPLLSLTSEELVQAHARSESPRSSKPPPALRRPPSTTTRPSTGPVTVSRVQELRVIFNTCTPCASCSRLFYDEEIMAMWVAAGDPPYTGLSCSSCRHYLMPRLIVRTIAILDITPSTNAAATTPSHGLIELSVPFLSPLVLRRQLEAVVDSGGGGGSGRSKGCAESMAVQALSSAGLLGHRRGRVLLWNLVYLLHRAGLPTHLLDAYPAWLMDAQAEARRLGGGRRVLLGGSLTIARALSEVTLSPDLPVCLVARWVAFPRKTAAGKEAPMLYRLWDNTHPACCLSPSSSVADLTVPADRGEERQECALEEIVQMAGDALTYENVGGAISAVRSLKRTAIQSVHRELLLLYARIHGTSWQQLNKFDAGYIAYLLDEMQQAGVQQQEQLQRWRANDEMPPSATALACRCIFRNLTLT